MNIFKVLFFVAALGLVGLTTGCRGCGCSQTDTNTNVERNNDKDKDIVRPDKDTPDKPKEDPKRGGDNPGNF